MISLKQAWNALDAQKAVLSLEQLICGGNFAKSLTITIRIYRLLMYLWHHNAFWLHPHVHYAKRTCRSSVISYNLSGSLPIKFCFVSNWLPILRLRVLEKSVNLQPCKALQRARKITKSASHKFEPISFLAVQAWVAALVRTSPLPLPMLEIFDPPLIHLAAV